MKSTLHIAFVYCVDNAGPLAAAKQELRRDGSIACNFREIPAWRTRDPQIVAERVSAFTRFYDLIVICADVDDNRWWDWLDIFAWCLSLEATAKLHILVESDDVTSWYASRLPMIPWHIEEFFIKVKIHRDAAVRPP